MYHKIHEIETSFTDVYHVQEYEAHGKYDKVIKRQGKLDAKFFHCGILILHVMSLPCSGHSALLISKGLLNRRAGVYKYAGITFLT